MAQEGACQAKAEKPGENAVGVAVAGTGGLCAGQDWVWLQDYSACC